MIRDHDANGIRTCGDFLASALESAFPSMTDPKCERPLVPKALALPTSSSSSGRSADAMARIDTDTNGPGMLETISMSEFSACGPGGNGMRYVVTEPDATLGR